MAGWVRLPVSGQAPQHEIEVEVEVGRHPCRRRDPALRRGVTDRSVACHDAQVCPHTAETFRDFDFHPDEDDVRVFTIPRSGLLRTDPGNLVYEVRYEDVVMRHYAFAEHWFKLNVTTDRDGHLVETRSPEPGIPPFAVNCDIATPLVWQDGNAVAVDLFLDVLVRQDARTYQIRDQDEFDQAVRDGLITPAEAAGARTGLATFVRLIEEQSLMPFLAGVVPFGLSTAPAALPESVVPLAEVELLGDRARRTGRPRDRT